MSRERTVLVTAATGNAGRNIVAALLASDLKVVATSRSPEKSSFPAGVEVRRYDADTETDFAKLFEEINSVVLVGPPLDGMVHRKLAPFIKAASAHRIGHLVYLSGNYLSGMTGRTLEDLPIRKVERQVEDSGLRHTIVRASFFMDNYTSGFYAPMVKDGRIALATGNGKSSLIAASDLGTFVAAALVQELTGEWIVTGPEALDHFEVADLLTRQMGRPIYYLPINEDELAAKYEKLGLPSESRHYGLTLYRSYRNFATAAVTDAFAQVTGREPRSFRIFLGLI